MNLTQNRGDSFLPNSSCFPCGIKLLHGVTLDLSKFVRNSKIKRLHILLPGITEPKKISIKDNLIFLQSEGLSEEKFREIKESGIDWLKKMWTRVYRRSQVTQCSESV